MQNPRLAQAPFTPAQASKAFDFVGVGTGMNSGTDQTLCKADPGPSQAQVRTLAFSKCIKLSRFGGTGGQGACIAKTVVRVITENRVLRCLT
jgi:hypothetical protein